MPPILLAGDESFTGPTNWGGTGLMETPTARIMKEGRFRVGISQADPYRYYYGTISPLKWLEINGRITQIFGTGTAQTGLPSSYGDYKDKAVDLKVQILRETKWLPALSVGVMDPHGTRIYASQYVVASKQLYPFDFTLGFGQGRFGKAPLANSGDEFKMEMFQNNSSWRSDGRFFGGVQFAVNDWLTLMAEYSPIAYEKQITDPAQPIYFKAGVPSQINYGLRVKPLDWLEAAISWQRGNQLGINVSMAFDLGVPMIPIYEKPYREKPELQRTPLKERIVKALEESGFSNIGIALSDGELLVEAQNDKYYYPARAVGVALRCIAGVLDKPGPGSAVDSQTVKHIRLTLAENRIPFVTFETSRDDLKQYLAETFTVKEYLTLGRYSTEETKNLPVMREDRKWWSWGLKPTIQTLLNDPSGFFKYRLGASGWMALNPWRGSSFVFGLDAFPLNNISSSNAPSAQAVRTDAWLYKKENMNLGLLMMEQIQKFSGEIYGRISGGYLEYQYGGFDGELAKPLLAGRVMVGVSGSYVKKRDVNNLFGFKKDDWKDWYTTGFANGRLNFPEVDAWIDVKAGQFLAGDRGARVSVSKSFNGVILSAWYSLTNTNIFTDSYNQGYHDKGIALEIPFRVFKGSDSRTVFDYALSPWTRDVAQDIMHFTNLFDYIGRRTKAWLKKDSVTKDRGFDQ